MDLIALIFLLLIPLAAGIGWWMRGRRVATDASDAGTGSDRDSIATLPDQTVLLRRIDRMILSGASLDEIAYEVVNLIPVAENFAGAVLRTVDNHRNLSVRAVSDLLTLGSEAFAQLESDVITPSDVRRNQSAMLQAVNSRQSVMGRTLAEFEVPPMTQQQAIDAERDLGIQGVVVQPIIVEENVLGTITFYLRVSEPSKHDEALMMAVRDEIALSLKNTRLLDRLENMNTKLEVTNEDLQQANATKDEFISIASHQLRSPLTAIKGHLSMLVDGDYGRIPTAQQPIVRRLAQSTNEVINIINDMLSMSRINANRLELTKSEVQLEELVSDVVAELQPLADLKKLKLVVELPKRRLAPVYVDALRLRQAIINFVDNAIKYTSRGKVDVKLTQAAQEYRFTVHDTGIGIPKSEQGKLFTKFYRTDNARAVVANGSGLGLFVVKQIVEQHGGTVFIESEGGKGSTFGFILPKAAVVLPPRKVADVTAPTAPVRPRPPVAGSE